MRRGQSIRGWINLFASAARRDAHRTELHMTDLVIYSSSTDPTPSLSGMMIQERNHENFPSRDRDPGNGYSHVDVHVELGQRAGQRERRGRRSATAGDRVLGTARGGGAT